MIYLDNAATTKVDDKVINEMNNYDPLRIEIINSENVIERFNFR